jgi:hypothetical protein
MRFLEGVGWIVVSVLIVVLVYGCSTMTINQPDGTKISYTSFMATTDQLDTTKTTLKFRAKSQVDAAMIQKILEAIGTGAVMVP